MPPSTTLTTARTLIAPLSRHASPVASSSRVQLRSLHCSSAVRDAWKNLAKTVWDGSGSSLSGRSGSADGAGSLGDRPGASKWATPRGLSGNRGGVGGGGNNSFAVQTTSSSPRPGFNSGTPHNKLRKPVLGQMIHPTGLTFENLRAERPNQARALLGPTKREAMQTDYIYRLGLNPGKPSLHDDSYKNPPLLAAFCTDMGKIRGRALTKLTIGSQRRVAKAIRRAKAMGLMPVLANTVNWTKKE